MDLLVKLSVEYKYGQCPHLYIEIYFLAGLELKWADCFMPIGSTNVGHWPCKILLTHSHTHATWTYTHSHVNTAFSLSITHIYTCGVLQMHKYIRLWNQQDEPGYCSKQSSVHSCFCDVFDCSNFCQKPSIFGLVFRIGGSYNGWSSKKSSAVKEHWKIADVFHECFINSSLLHDVIKTGYVARNYFVLAFILFSPLLFNDS